MLRLVQPSLPCVGAYINAQPRPVSYETERTPTFHPAKSAMCRSAGPDPAQPGSGLACFWLSPVPAEPGLSSSPSLFLLLEYY
jgi:hypothetical protein